MEKKTDLRVLRTKKLIKEAFLTLIKKKGFQAITIQDIAEEAFINRATFYLHYQDKYDLLDQICNNYLNELMDVINFSFHIQNGEINVKRFKITIQKVFEKIEEDLEFYKVMFGPNGVPDFSDKVEEFIFAKFKANFTDIVGDLSKLDIPADFLLNFISSAYIGVVKWWLNTDNRYSPEYMADHLAKIITKGPMSAIGHKITFKN